jgi:amino acid adenylation domain-containing protein
MTSTSDKVAGTPPGWTDMVPGRVMAQAGARPAEIAVIDAHGSITYAGLADSAHRWRAALAAARPDSTAPLVAILLPRGAELLAVQLGVWLSGGAFLPLDPALPATRIAQVISDAGCAVAVTTAELAHLLPPGTAVITEPGAAAVAREPLPDLRGNSPAYVIYTSGSTGQPKGVLVEHGTLARLFDWYGPYFGLGPRTRVGAFSGIGFDAHILDTWAALSAGAQLHMPAESAVRNVDEVISTLTDREISHCFLMTAIAEILLTTGVCPPALRTLMTGADRLRVWPPAGFPAAVYNAYGPTEATILSTITGDLRTHPARDQGLPPIGRPVGATRAQLRDPEGLVISEPDVPGELWLGGDCLARGYLHAPALTADRFVSDGAGRWYRSGDVCAWTTDGELDFRGRTDDQVKLRGHRIEPGEIEHVLIRQPKVSQCAVVLCERGGERVLAAFVQADAGPEELRQHLAGLLPAYMVPAEFTVLESLPLNAAGKIDRAALAAAGPGRQQAEPGGAPRTEAERLIAATWSDVLGRMPSRDSDFFDLGGDSLRAHRVTLRVGEALGVRPRIAALFEHRTLSAYAAAVSEPTQAGGA